VLVIAPTPFFGDRGCHVRVLEEVRALGGLGIDTLVVTYHLGRDVPGAAVVRAPRVPWVRSLPVGFSVHKPYLDLLLLVQSLRAARRFRPHVLHGHLHEGAAIAAVLGRLLGVPAVADLQGSVTGEMVAHGHLRERGALPAAMQAAERLVVRWPARLLTSSANYAGELLERWGCPPRRIVCLPDGIDPDFLRPGQAVDDLRERLGLTGRRVVAYIGVLTRYQGVDDLVAAWPAVVAAVPDAHLLLMGYPRDDHYRAEVARRGLGGSVTVTGRIPYEETPRYLALADLGVSPKLAGTEANGKLLNYMACGLPAVAYDGPVSRELLGDAGTYVAPRDLGGLAAAISGLLLDPGERKRRGEALRERAVTRFGWPALAWQLRGIYREVVATRGA
jgi:glycosyltransferase involved in cell wall biosynthesis